VAAGYRALDTLRLEKGYRYWSAELTPEHTPWEAGLDFCVKLGKGDFIGRAALVAQKARGVGRRLACLVLDSRADVALGGEPVLRAGEVVGRVTSGGVGPSVGRSIAYAYVPADAATPGERVAVMLFGQPIPATVVRDPLYDPRGARIRA
jgi:4-methylaminobutanoate oxidase (formaldehyde-forming)